MAARTTTEEVLEIMGKSSSGTINIQPYINSANTVISRIFANDNTVSIEFLTEIEKWFTAHLLASTVWRQSTEEKIGDATIKFAGEFGSQLDFTSYGQMVQQLDYTGKMAGSIGKPKYRIIAIKSFCR